MIKIQIRSIDVLVHPDFYQMCVLDSNLHPIQKELRRRWDARAAELAGQEGAVMLYFSARNTAVPQINNPIVAYDLDRIRRYWEQLGNRFFLFGKWNLPTRDKLIKLFAERGFTYTPDTVVCVYGEIFEDCVKSFEGYIRFALGIPDSNYRLLKDFSLTLRDIYEIERWRERIIRRSRVN